MATACESRERPKVGVSVIVTHRDHPNQVLVGIRKGSIGAGQYAFPGGHLEFCESWEECGAREILEETDLKLKNVFFVTAVNAIDSEEKAGCAHYVIMFVQGEVDTSYKAEPRNMEPQKCLGWQWIDWDEFLPHENLFCCLRMLREDTHYHPFKSITVSPTENKI